MLIPNHLVIPESLAVTSLEFTGVRIVVYARVTSATACCPTCQMSSRRVHSHYTRTLADLPWGGMPVSFQVVVRRFRCPESDCSQRIFAERLEEVTQVYARRTSRHQEILLLIAFALGGEAGARVAWELACGVSAWIQSKPSRISACVRARDAARSGRGSETTPAIVSVAAMRAMR